MRVFNHLLYEYEKGLRKLALHTFSVSEKSVIIHKVEKHNIDYCIQHISAYKCNIFFGSDVCVDVVRRFGLKPLNEYTCEEDFILGIMLGYDREKQCERYLKIKECENTSLLSFLKKHQEKLNKVS